MGRRPHFPPKSELTRFLADLGRGGADPDSPMMRFVYDELRATAGAYVRRRPPSASLQPTVLVHDAFVRLFRHGPVDWNDRVHFFAVAAKAMRQILVNHARDRRGKTASSLSRIELAGVGIGDVLDVDLLDLDDALCALSRADERAGRVVELRFFGGLSIEDTAAALDVSHATVERDWSTARAWLGRRLSGGGPA